MGIHIPHGKGQFAGEKGRPIVKYRKLCGDSCAKTAEWIKMPFWLWAPVGSRNRVYIRGGSWGKDPHAKEQF